MYQILDKRYTFPKVQYIHPRKQKECYDIIKAVGDRCNLIIVFGSATQLECDKNSDTDLLISVKDAFEYEDICRKISKCCKNGCDIIWAQFGGVTGRLRDEIIKKGVQIV